MSVDPSKMVPAPRNGHTFHDLGTAFGEVLKNIVEGIGSILAGAVTAAGSVLKAIFDGVAAFVGHFASAIAYLFRPRDVYVPPPAEYMSPIAADAEAAVKHWTDKTDLALERAEEYRTAAEQATNDLAQAIDPNHPDSHIFKLIVAVEEAQNETLALHAEAIRANKNAIESLLEYVQRTLHVPADAAVSNEHWEVGRAGSSPTGGTVTLTAKPGWVGTALIARSNTYVESVEGGYAKSKDTVIESFPVPGLNNNRVITVSSTQPWGGSRRGSQPAEVTVFYTINPGIAKTVPIRASALRTLQSGQWTPVAEWEVPDDTNVVADAKFTWANKTWAGTYRARLTLDGVDITAGVATKSAPLSISNQRMSGGQRLRLEAYAAHGNPLNRELRDVEMNVTWIEGGPS